MTLARHLATRIAQTGPLSVAAYMQTCAMHPTWGYYTTRTPFGAKGDFVTAPEISQMFGELIGLSLAQMWLDQGGPSPFSLVELGPGRGTLMADLLRATRSVPGFNAAAQVILIDASPALRREQARRLSAYDPIWINNTDDLPPQTTFLIANEFFDALPIRQFVRDGAGWRERQVGLAEGVLSFGLGPTLPQPALAHRLDDTKDGDLVEDCPAAAPILQPVSARIAAHGGGALIVDYGDWRSLGDTLQALQGHASVPPLASPGEADLTAHVDFEALAQACAPAAHSRVTPQGVFLERLGIAARAETLARGLSGPALEQHLAAHRRLTHPAEMGNLFKVIGMMPQGAAPPPGLEQ